jgi:hypothetical protein
MVGIGLGTGLGLVLWQLPTRAIPVSFPLIVQAQVVPPQQLQANAEAFVDALFAQKYDLAWQYLAPKVQDENPPNILQRKHDAFLKRTGPFRQRVSARVSGEVVVVKIKFSKLTDDLILIMQPNGKIIGVDFPADDNDISAQPPAQ